MYGQCSLYFVFASFSLLNLEESIKAAGYFALVMERLFSPCTRYRAMHGIQNPPLRELNLDVSTYELLSAKRGFTYADLFTMLVNESTVLWLTPHAAIVRGSANERGENGHSWERPFYFDADGKIICILVHSHEHFLEIFDVVVRLLIASEVCTVRLPKCVPCQGARTSASCCTNRSESLLDALIRECRSCLPVDVCDDDYGGCACYFSGCVCNWCLYC